MKSYQTILSFAIVILIASFYFYNLGGNEIQPWDEAMYAARSRAVAEHGAFFDQTGYSSGGLYSSVHPPLSIWMTALNYKIFGISEFSSRLWSLLTFCGSILLLFFLAGKGWEGVSAVFLFSLNIAQYYYSRLGQLDAPMQFFLLLAFFFWTKYLKNNQQIYVGLTGIAFGLCLMSKALIGLFIPASIGIWLVYQIIKKQINFKNAIIDFGILLIIGLAIALPWHIYMLAIYQEKFLNFFIFYHVIERIGTGVEQNTRSLGYFFYINQFVTIYSFFLIFALITLKEFRIDRKTSFLWISLIIISLIFSVSQTKIFSYMLTMLPILVILISDGIGKLLKIGKIGVLPFVISIIAAIWSFSQALRILVKKLFYFSPNYSIAFIFLSLLTMSIALKFRKKEIKFNHFTLACFIIYFIVKFIFSQNFYIYHSHLKHYSELFFKDKYAKLIYIDDENKSYTYDPQITYYFDMIDKKSPEKFTYYNTERDNPNNNDTMENNVMIIFNKVLWDSSCTKFFRFFSQHSRKIGEDSVYYYYSTKIKR